MISRKVFAPGIWTPKNPHHIGIHAVVTLRTYLYRDKEKFENFEDTRTIYVLFTYKSQNVYYSQESSM